MSVSVDIGETFVRRVTLTAEENCGNADFDVEKVTLNISQKTIGDVGCVVWDAALVLSQVLARSEAFSDVPWNEQLAVELGAGTGLVGLVAAMLGSDVVLTDLRDCVPLMELNCRENACKLRGSVHVAELDWTNRPADFRQKYCDGRNVDLLLMADVIYYEASLLPLLETMKELCSSDTRILMSYEDRTTGNKVKLKEEFFSRAKEAFLVEELPQEIFPEEYRCDEIHIVAMKLKS